MSRMQMRSNEPYNTANTGDSHSNIKAPKDVSQKTYKPKPKSLFFCLVLTNPFEEYEKAKANEQKEEKTKSGCCGSGDTELKENTNWDDNFEGYKEKGKIVTYLRDDDFLLTKKKRPSDFAKVMEMVRRLDYRGFDMIPNAKEILEDHDPSKESHRVPGNKFHGMSLTYENMIVSPDKDEVYLCIHAHADRLLEFCEVQHIRLRTHEMSALGGAMAMYSAETSEYLAASMKREEAYFKKEVAILDEDDKYRTDDEDDDDDGDDEKEDKPPQTSELEKNLREDQERRQRAEEERKAKEEQQEHELVKCAKEEDDEDTEWIFFDDDDSADEMEGLTEPGSPKRKSKSSDGFRFDVSDKMRIVERMVREPFEFGGCGLQVYEMRNKGILVRHFIPLHNKYYQREYGIDRWGSFGALVRCCRCCCCGENFDDDYQKAITLEQRQKFDRCNADKTCCGCSCAHPWVQHTQYVMKYFGEQVALYFYWIHEYTFFLWWIAIAGIICGILPYIHGGVSRAIVNGVFALLCVAWGVAWNARWHRLEQVFATVNGQGELADNEYVRDEYESTNKRLLREDLFLLRFITPLTVHRERLLNPTSEYHTFYYVDRYYAAWKRTMWRWFFSYPVIVFLTAAMVALLTLITWARFEYNDRGIWVSYVASILAVVTANVFGVIFEKFITLMIYLENMRTDTEAEHQRIMRNFFFSFFSFYYSLFVIALYPRDDITDTERLKELQTQMIIICAVKPAVQNLQETLLPFAMTHWRRRVDVFGGFCGALKSLCSCQKMPDEYVPSEKDVANCVHNPEILGRLLWKESQRQPYESTSGDYLEIVLQFGYMVMFAAVFPWAPICALFYNTIEIRLDGWKLLKFHQRPLARPAKDIGSWRWIMAALTGFSIITNSYLICHLSPAAVNTGVPDHPENRWRAFSLLQYFLIIICTGLYIYSTGIPDMVQRTKVKHRLLLEEDTIRKARNRAIEKSKLRALNSRLETSLNRRPVSAAATTSGQQEGLYSPVSGNPGHPHDDPNALSI